MDVSRPSQLLDIVEGRTAKAASTWIEARQKAWRDDVRWATLDLSGPYRKAFTDSLPQATQVADPFHVTRLANTKLDECRRRVQNETLGHRGRKDDPLYRSRRLLTKGHERLDDKGEQKLLGFLEAGDPKGEVRLAWHDRRPSGASTRSMIPPRPGTYLSELVDDLVDRDRPPEVRSLGRTLRRWHTEIVARHQARVSNGPTEATNNLIKRVKRIGFGFRKFAHYRLRALLYAGKPNWERLATITPR